MKNAAFAASLAAVAALAGPAQAGDAETLFHTAFADTCYFDESHVASEDYPVESWTLSWQEDYSDTEYSGTLYQFFCFSGAYNVNLVYYFEDPFEGFTPVAFAVPRYDVKYVDDDFDGAVESVTMRGFSTQWLLTNPVFDPQTNTVESHALWRGLGDAASSGRWVFDKGTFVLKSYDVDASYDGEINPQRIVEYK